MHATYGTNLCMHTSPHAHIHTIFVFACVFVCAYEGCTHFKYSCAWVYSTTRACTVVHAYACSHTLMQANIHKHTHACTRIYTCTITHTHIYVIVISQYDDIVVIVLMISMVSLLLPETEAEPRSSVITMISSD